MRRILYASVLAVLVSIQAASQPQTDTAPPKFEVVSVRPSAPLPPGRRNTNIRRSTGGRFTTNNAGIKTLMQIAYRVQDFQIVGGPDWIDSAEFDIVAVPEKEISFDNPAADPMPRMLEAILADRFQLKVHREVKDMATYELVIARNGSKLQEAKGADGKNWGFSQGPNGLKADNAPIPIFADVLSRELHRKVVDKTGLTGYFDFTMRWAPDPPPVASPISSDLPSIFTALQEQLGLRLQSERGPVEVIVIDSVEKPSEN